ncbi:MAG: cyclopropane-fatty-acyl-phospholipid synthase [Gammaproteobacteria bacterium RIFCSPHIGHO2_12_FULL_38_14]|nr:MAG: cyclopropane-fatty-acyl-phospholipid synthase [Gammaproteobacteria bacterium RIFCSPHIGHO2_12_FULL_38_14]
MDSMTLANQITDYLESAGITINGSHPWDIQVHREELYGRVMQEGPLGLGEAYMEKWWDCERLDQFFYLLLKASLDKKIKTNVPFSFYTRYLLSYIINFQSKQRAKEVAIKHYNLGNNLFENMLDPYMIYSCAYFKNTDKLAEAQVAKLELICQKLQLKPGLRVLDIGCGFGGFAKYAALKHGVHVTGITISEQQYHFAKKFCEGLPISLFLKDYRDLNEQFDRVVSIGMFEHVGYKNYETFIETVHRVLSNDGLFLLHTIGSNETSTVINEWTLKYIFPNGMLPSIAEIAKHVEKKFIVEDWQNFGAYYDPTLIAWYDNFKNNWHAIKSQFDERFYRMWTYYLLSCAGSFRARMNQVWQIVFSKHGVPGVYMSPR